MRGWILVVIVVGDGHHQRPTLAHFCLRRNHPSIFLSSNITLHDYTEMTYAQRWDNWVTVTMTSLSITLHCQPINNAFNIPSKEAINDLFQWPFIRETFPLIKDGQV